MRRLLTSLQQVLSARNRLEARLFPALKSPVKFRPYIPADFDACVEIYKKNEPGRFPAGNITAFEKYLASETRTLIVAELDSKVVAYGGLVIHPPRSATFCYGIVDPAFQGRQIGTTLTLLRLSVLPPYPGDFVILIFAVDASLDFYRRFGFYEIGSWSMNRESRYPVGALRVSPQSLDFIRGTLHKRGVQIEGNLVFDKAESKTHEILESREGVISVKFMNTQTGGSSSFVPDP